MSRAGVTFIYNRWRRRGQDRVLAWQDAAAVLANTLDNDAWLNPTHLNRQDHHPDSEDRRKPNDDRDAGRRFWRARRFSHGAGVRISR
jgi:hypothetical protein